MNIANTTFQLNFMCKELVLVKKLRRRGCNWIYVNWNSAEKSHLHTYTTSLTVKEFVRTSFDN